jgi:hypothetical protein
MNPFQKSFLSITLFAFAKLALATAAQAEEPASKSAMKEVESKTLLQELFQKISPVSYRKLNDLDHDMSFIK